MVKQGINATVICHYGYSCRRTRSCAVFSSYPIVLSRSSSPLNTLSPSNFPSLFIRSSFSPSAANRFALLRIISDRIVEKKASEKKRREDNEREKKDRRPEWKQQRAKRCARRRLIRTKCAIPGATPSAIHHRKCHGMNNGRINVAADPPPSFSSVSGRIRSAGSRRNGFPIGFPCAGDARLRFVVKQPFRDYGIH